jgi:hypothetical protein
MCGKSARGYQTEKGKKRGAQREAGQREKRARNTQGDTRRAKILLKRGSAPAGSRAPAAQKKRKKREKGQQFETRPETDKIFSREGAAPLRGAGRLRRKGKKRKKEQKQSESENKE